MGWTLDAGVTDSQLAIVLEILFAECIQTAHQLNGKFAEHVNDILRLPATLLSFPRRRIVARIILGTFCWTSTRVPAATTIR